MDCILNAQGQTFLIPQYDGQSIPGKILVLPVNCRKYDQNQTTILPTNIIELIPPNHSAWIINDIFNKLDYTEFYRLYNKEGSPAYNPVALLKGIFYCMYTGTYSSRKIAERFRFDVAVMFLSASQKPDYRTISRVLNRFSMVIEDFFKQIVHTCMQLGLVGMFNVSIDGTKIKANASVKKTYDMDRCEKIIKKCLEEIRKIDEQENAELGESDGLTIPDELADPEARNEKIQKLLGKVNEMEKIKADLTATGKDSINTTDPDAPLMKMGGEIGPAYNAQLAVDSTYGVIVSAHVTDEQNDTQQFIETYESVVKITGQIPKAVTADAGYASYEVLQYLENENIDGYIPDTRMRIEKAGKTKRFPKGKFVYNVEMDEYTCPNGRKLHVSGKQRSHDGKTMKKYTTDCKGCPLHDKCTKSKRRTITRHPQEHLREAMRKKLDSDTGKEIYLERMSTVEPVNADVKYNQECYEFSVRGKAKANSQLSVYSILHNLKKIIKFTLSSMVESGSSFFHSIAQLFLQVLDAGFGSCKFLY
jgi:transposase